MAFSPLSSLHSRLAVSYAAAVFAALAVFGTIAVIIIDRNLHASLDSRLRTTARAALNFIDVKEGIDIDQKDRQQLLALAGSQMNLAILKLGSGVVFSTSALPSQDLVAQAQQAQGFASLRGGRVSIRVLMLPIASADKNLGAVIVWADSAWINDTDRQVAIAFAVAALLLAAVATLAGSAVSRRALEDAFERQRRFTTDASHELRAPLSVIRAEADLALRRPRDAPTYQSALTAIAAETDRMEKLVSTLLVAARAQDAQGERRVVDLHALAQRACRRLHPTADVKELTISVQGSEPCNALGDADAIERAFTAVLHNAIKHTPDGGSITVSLAQRLGNCELQVHDTGPGFSADALAHGLEWFWRGEPDGANEATGLGLAIANSLVRAGGGAVTLANGPTGGADVAMTFPAR